MALDNAQFISELSITDPPGTDAVAEGDDHIRTTKRATQQSFPNVDAAVPQTAAQMGQMAIKNEVNTFTQVNVFTNRNDFQNIRFDAAAGATRGLQYYLGGLQSWAISNNFNVPALQFQRHDIATGVFVDTPISIDQATGQVDFVTEVHGASRFQLNNANFVQSHSGDRGFAYENSANGETEWIMQARGTSKGWRLRRFTAGVEVDSPISVDFTTGEVTFPNICTFSVGLTALDGAISLDRVDTTRNLNWRRNGASVWQIQHQNDANDNTWRLRRNDLTTGALLSVPIQVRQSDGLIFLTLQASDPGVTGALWNNAGFVAVSP